MFYASSIFSAYVLRYKFDICAIYVIIAPPPPFLFSMEIRRKRQTDTSFKDRSAVIMCMFANAFNHTELIGIKEETTADKSFQYLLDYYRCLRAFFTKNCNF